MEDGRQLSSLPTKLEQEGGSQRWRHRGRLNHNTAKYITRHNWHLICWSLEMMSCPHGCPHAVYNMGSVKMANGAGWNSFIVMFYCPFFISSMIHEEFLPSIRISPCCFVYINQLSSEINKSPILSIFSWAPVGCDLKLTWNRSFPKTPTPTTLSSNWLTFESDPSSAGLYVCPQERGWYIFP